MIARYAHLSQYPQVFVALTGLRVREFDHLVADVLPAYGAARTSTLSRRPRKHAIGAGAPFALPPRDQILLTVIWLRVSPTLEVLGYLFGVSDTTAQRAVTRVLPLLEQAGRDTMQPSRRGQRSRRTLAVLLHDLPDLVVIIDSFEQPVQRPQERDAADGYDSGKKKRHTLKSQVTGEEHRGRVLDVSARVPGPTADLTLRKESGVWERLPPEMGALSRPG